jgi:hypothetical protein
MSDAPRKKTGHLIAAVACGIIGGLALLASLLQAGAMIYWNAKAGPIEYSGGEHESLDQIALTTHNVGRTLGALVASVFGVTAGIAWWKENTRRAIALTIVFFLLMWGWGAFVELTKPPRRKGVSLPGEAPLQRFAGRPDRVEWSQSASTIFVKAAIHENRFPRTARR